MDTAASPSPQVVFGGTTFNGGHSGWTLESNQPMQQFMSGPATPIHTGGILVNFSSTQPFSFQWAEVQWNGASYTLLGSGTVLYSGSGWSPDSTFDHRGDIVPLPLPASALLLSTGLLGMGLVGWRRKGG
jgi:hypothetical protein